MSLENFRQVLKHSLFMGRGEHCAGIGWDILPICPYCGRPVKMKDADLHEALITKGMVKGVDPEGYINSQFNCVIRHHDTLGCTHTGGVGGDDDFEKSVRYLVRWEGAENVRRWLQGAKMRWSTVGADALRRFDSIRKELSNDS